MKKFFILIIVLMFSYANEIKFYQNLIDNKQIIINPEGFNIPSFREAKVSKNGKIYINFNTLSADPLSTQIKHNYLCISYLNSKASGLGKVYTYKYICFKAYLSQSKKNHIAKYEDYTNYDFVFEITPVRRVYLSINQTKIDKFCFDTEYPDPLLDEKGHFYCYNGYCYPLSNFINYIENNFPQNENLILNLPNIECDLNIYHYDDDNLDKIIIINNQTHKIKDIIDID